MQKNVTPPDEHSSLITHHLSLPSLPQNWAEQRPSDIPLVVLDTETTGLSPKQGHRVVEIGAVRFENGKQTAEFSQLLYPQRKMDPRASRINGITDADLAGQPAFADIAPELLALLDGAVLVAHNAPFDAGFLGMEFYINGYQIESGGVPSNPWACTLQLARRHFYFGRNNLSHIARQMGIRMGRAHRALTDVYMTAEIFKRMTQKLAKQNLVTIGDVLHAQGGAIYTPAPGRED
jgi:DNA polymerase III epsilon subunit